MLSAHIHFGTFAVWQAEASTQTKSRLSGTLPDHLSELNDLNTLVTRYYSPLQPRRLPEKGTCRTRFFFGLRQVIHDTNLAGTLPVELSKLGKLGTFELFENKISGTVPDAVKDMLGRIRSTQCSLAKNCLDPVNVCQGQTQRPQSECQ